MAQFVLKTKGCRLGNGVEHTGDGDLELDGDDCSLKDLLWRHFKWPILGHEKALGEHLVLPFPKFEEERIWILLSPDLRKNDVLDGNRLLLGLLELMSPIFWNQTFCYFIKFGQFFFYVFFLLVCASLVRATNIK